MESLKKTYHGEYDKIRKQQLEYIKKGPRKKSKVQEEDPNLVFLELPVYKAIQIVRQEMIVSNEREKLIQQGKFELPQKVNTLQ